MQPSVRSFYELMITGSIAPVDYNEFMRIGASLRDGSFAYGINVYYPLPTITVFAFFAWLPDVLSKLLYFTIPVIVALWIVDWDPLVLFFAPLAAHFLGGQASVFGLISLWGVLRFRDDWPGGIFLAVGLLKPQLAIVPVAYFGILWLRQWMRKGTVSAQLPAFLVTALVLAMPAFLISPGWVQDWLGNLRPLFPRAMAGIVPRVLLLVQTPQVFWIGLVVIALGLFIWLLRLNRGRFPLELAVLWNFVVSPLVHDYDLIQLIPLLRRPKIRRAALLVSIPCWYVLIAKYQHDEAWLVFAFIAPVLILAWFLDTNQADLLTAKR